MINRIHIENFKSLESVSVETPKITLLIGPNGSGKSSVVQALAIMKNFVLNSNRSQEEIFNLGYLRLGSITDVLWQHHPSRHVIASIHFKGKSVEEEFTLEFGVKTCSSRLKVTSPLEFDVKVDFNFPYAQSQSTSTRVNLNGVQWQFVWNGVTGAMTNSSSAPESIIQETKETVSELSTLHTNTALSIFVTPTMGAFYNNVYSVVGIPDKKTLLSIPEGVLATIFQQDADLEERVSTFMEEIFHIKNVRAKITYPNTSLFVGRRKIAANIVNEGLGLNRIAFLLATVLTAPPDSMIALEEPENNLHPEAQVQLAHALSRIVNEEQRQLVISTHSEHLLLGFLSQISRRVLSHKDVAIYFSELDSNEMKTKFERAEVNEKGQVKGGLRGFFESDVEALTEVLRNLSESEEDHGRDSYR